MGFDDLLCFSNQLISGNAVAVRFRYGALEALRAVSAAVLQPAGYSYKIGVNPEVVATMIAACAEGSDVKFFSSKHLLDVSAYERSCGMAIGSAAAGGLFTCLLFPVFEPGGLSRRGSIPS